MTRAEFQHGGLSYRVDVEHDVCALRCMIKGDWESVAMAHTIAKLQVEPDLLAATRLALRKPTRVENTGHNRGVGELRSLVVAYLHGKGWTSSREIADACNSTASDVNSALRKRTDTFDTDLRDGRRFWRLR